MAWTYLLAAACLEVVMGVALAVAGIAGLRFTEPAG